MKEKITVNNGADALTVSVKDTATFLRLMREHTTVPNLKNHSIYNDLVKRQEGEI